MSIFTIEEILEVLSTKVISGQSPQCLKKRIRRVISDSRLVRGGDLFVAFVGDRYDGHAFVPAAMVQGAVGAIVREDYVLPPPKTKRMVRPVLLGVKDHASRLSAARHASSQPVHNSSRGRYG